MSDAWLFVFANASGKSEQERQHPPYVLIYCFELLQVVSRSGSYSGGGRPGVSTYNNGKGV